MDRPNERGNTTPRTLVLERTIIDGDDLDVAARAGIGKEALDLRFEIVAIPGNERGLLQSRKFEPTLGTGLKTRRDGLIASGAVIGKRLSRH